MDSGSRASRSAGMTGGVLISANAPLSRDFVVRTPRCARLPVFLPSPQERDGAPGGAQGALRSAPLGQPCDRPACTPSFRDPSFGGGGGPVTRGPPARKPGRLSALHRGTRCRRPHLAPRSDVAIDDARGRARHGVGTAPGKEKKGYSNWSVNSLGKVGTVELSRCINALSRHHRAAA